MPRKTVIIIALSQTLVIFLANVVLGMMLKLYGYPDKNELVARWNDLPVALRSHGHWLLLLPIIWVLFDQTAGRSPKSIIWRRVSLVIAVVIILTPVILTICAIRDPYVWKWYW